MSTSKPAAEGDQVLICAPFGRDADGAALVVRQGGHQAVVCADLRQVAQRLGADVGVILLTEDALKFDRSALADAIASQPAWSDVPFILLVSRPLGGGRQVYPRQRQALPANNVVVLERPMSSQSLTSAINSAIVSRGRQFQMRDRLDELARARESLEERVAERTAELQAEMQSRTRAEAALRQSQKMEAVGQLTGGIAHDFNNMLTGIMGSLDLLRRRLASGRTDDLDRYLDAAAASAGRAAALTHRLLAFSRRQSLDPKAVDVNGLILAMDELLRRAVHEKVELAFDLAAEIPSASVDPNELESAVLNLAINARDAMPDGGALTIETSVVDLDPAYAVARPGINPGRYVVVAVSDSGVGMSSELVEKVFDPFFTTKPLGQGTGLGLSMVYGFAKQSGGQVRIHSQPGVGTSVKIYLPASDKAPAEAHARPTVLPDGDGEQVLVVEDDAAVRMLVREVLEELHYRPVEFADPLTALPYLASDRRIDLMISDVGLPGMNGRELAEKARASRPDLPILFVTGYAENAAIRTGFLGSNMSMVTKPFTLDVLAGKITEMIKAR